MHSGGWALSHQVVKEDVGGLSGQIADVQQQLPQHVDQLILERQQQLGKLTKLLELMEFFLFVCIAVFMS